MAEWPDTDWYPPGWWGEHPTWPEEREPTLPVREVSASSLLFAAGAVLLVGIVVGYQLYALAKGWVR